MEIKEFVRSLTTDQLQGLIRFSKHRLRGGITGAIEDHLEGNSEDFEFVFGDPADGDIKIVFDNDYPAALLLGEFSINLAEPKTKALMMEFKKLSNRYEKFRKFLEENISLYGVNPANEPVIGPNGQFIEIHPAKNPQMRLNPGRLNLLANKIKKDNR